MQPLRLKAFRRISVLSVLLVAAIGCESDGKSVSAAPSLPVSGEEKPILLAQAGAPASGDTEKASVSTDVPSNAGALTTQEETAKAIAEVGATNVPPSEVTANAPVITKEIPPARPGNLKISDSVEKIIKLTESNLDEQVILTFVQQTPSKFDLDADEIVYLSDLGVPSSVISAMLKHDGDDPSKAEALTAAPNTENVQPAIPANTNAAAIIAQTQPPPPGTISQPQGIQVTTNYTPNPTYYAQQPVYQQPPVVVQQPVIEEAPQVVYAEPETVNYFYDSLSPYGSWFYVSDYGWCWQPTVAVVDHGWRPYGPRGQWLWTDAGWYWSSDYSWGWAPFHYGRWFMHGGRGWIWCPDRVWGPSWVAWRGSGDYCGWAPLPPHAVFTPGIGFTYFGRGVDISFGFGLGFDAFCFAPVGRFHNRHVYNYCLPRHETLGVFAHSRVENRWEFRDGRREFVNRAGPRLETGVRPATVRTMSEHDQGRFGAREHVERTGRDTVIYRPPAPPAPPAPATVAGRSPGAPQRAASEAFRPGTRGGVSTGPSAATGIATGAGQPRARDPRSARGSADEPTRSPVTSRPSPLAGREAPTAVTPGQTTSPAGRNRELPSRSIAGNEPSPATTQTPAPSTTTPAPRRSVTPIEPGARGSRTPETAAVPTPSRPAPIVSDQPAPTVTRRPIAEATPPTRALPGSPAYNNLPRPITSAPPAPAQREITRQESPRVLTPSTTVAPPPRTVAPPPQISMPPPRTVAPPPATSTAPRYSAPAYTPPMRGNSPSPAPAPTYQAPVSRAPVYQAPVTRTEPPRQANNPTTVQPGRGRGRD